MRRFLSIAICSLVPLTGMANYSKPGYYNGTPLAVFPSLDAPESFQVWAPGQNPYYPELNFRSRFVFRGLNAFAQALSVRNEDTGQIVLNRNTFNNNSWASWVSTPNYVFDAPATNSFSWTFPAEWAGTTVQIRATNGTVLGTWAIPNNVGPNGFQLSTSVITNQSLLSGAQVFLDGVSAASLAMAGTNANLNSFADRPGYSLSFGPDYAGGEWQVRREDGTIAASGSAATLGTVASGRVTILPKGSTGSIWTRMSAGDGAPAVWVNTGVTVSGNNVTTYNFISAPQPTPVPTPSFMTNAPAPTITNSPAPLPSPGTNTVAPASVSTNDVTVDVDTLPEIETNDGEQGVLDQVTSMSQKFRGAIEKFQDAFENVALTFNEFRKFTLGGVGTNCTLSIGPVNLNLSGIVPDAVRSGMKLFILLVGVFAAIRYTWETFA